SDGLAGFPYSLLSQLSRQTSTLTPRLPGGRPCVAHCLPSFLLYAHHVPFLLCTDARRMCRILFSLALCNSTARPAHSVEVGDAAESEHRDRIDGRGGAARNRQRRDHQHELPSLATRGGLTHGIEVRAIEQMHSEDGQHEIVQRAWRQIARRMRRVVGCLPSEYGDVAFLEPRDHGVVEAGHRVVDRPGT